MKKRLLFCLPLSTLLLSGVFVAALSKSSVTKAGAIGNYSTNASTYYNGITATSGQQLAAQLHDLITYTHQYYTSYDDNGSNGYQKNTDQYYENGSKVNGYIYEFYSGAKWPSGWYPSSGNTNGGYNREHCWCQSNSVNTGGTQMWGETGGGADMHHLRPVEVRLNSTRNNHPYGELTVNRDSCKRYAQLGTSESYLGGYYYGDVFEPIDSKKGDVARIILYTYLHYNSYSVSSLFGSYGTTNGNGSSSYFSTSLLSLTKIVSESTEAKARELLLKWNNNDPVDDIERRRNEQVAVYQGNRNPFIDNSAYADAIWGDSVGIKSISKASAELTTGETTTISAISSTGGNITWTTSNSSVCSISSSTSASGSDITLTAAGAGSATITAKITISGTTYSKTCAVTVTAPKTLSSISIGNDVKTSYRVGDSFIRPTITATYTDSTTKDVTNSATFSGYNLSTTGSQTVTVSYTENGGTKTKTYSITVSEAVAVYYQKCTSMSDIENGGKYVLIGYKSSTDTYYAMPSYTSGNNNIKGVAVTLTESNTRLTQANMSTAAVYTLESTGTTNQYYIGDGSNYLYAAGSNSQNYLKAKSDKESSSGAFTFSYSTFFSVVAASSNRNTMRFNPNGSNDPLFSCYASDATQTEVMFFKETEAGPSPVGPTLSSITLDTTNVQTTFVLNETFDYTGLVVTAHYSDGSTEDLDSYSVSSPDMSTTGQKTITVSHGGQSATYTITVSSSRSLSSISISGQKTTYYVNDSFSFNGTCTAHYDDTTTAIVNPTNVSSPDMTTAGQKTVTVSYTEGGVTKTAEYQINVREAGSNVTVTVSVADYANNNDWVNGTRYPSIALDEVATAYARASTETGNTGKYYTSGNEWRFYQTESAYIEISLLTGYELESITLTYSVTNTGALFNGETQLSSGAAISASGTSASYTVGNTGEAQNGQVKFTSISVTYRLPAELTSISLDTSNVQKTFAVNETFNYTGLIVTAHYNDSSTKTVTPTNVSTPSTASVGQKTVTVSYTEGTITKTATYTITVNTNPTLTWTAPLINVFAGTTLTSTEANSWGVTYNNGSGTISHPSYGQFSVKLGGTTISLPYTWQAGDDEKTLCVSYSDLTTNTTAVSIVQNVNAINTEVPGDLHTSDLTFTAACGGVGTADDGKGWTITSDGTESSFDSQYGKGIHYGTSSAAVQYIKLTSTAFTSGTITSIVVQASTASGVSATVSVKVGGSAFGGEAQALTSSNAPYTFNGEASAGTIEVLITKPSSATKAIYCKGVAVTYSTQTQIVNLANVAGHENAQRVAVKFAKAFNAAMDTTSGCTTNLSSAWSTCQSAYNTFKSEAAALGSTEEVYAKNLIKYATAQYSDNSGEACIERMMKTYEVCVQKHGQTAFMSDLVTLSRISNINPLQMIRNNANTVAIVIVVSMVSLAAIGGYFFLRRKKED